MINKCRKMEAELSTFWPEWHVTGIVDEGGSGDLFLIRKESFGIRVDSALKVIRCGDSVESSALFCAAERMDPEETLLMDMTGFFVRKARKAVTIYMKEKLPGVNREDFTVWKESDTEDI